MTKSRQKSLDRPGENPAGESGNSTISKGEGQKRHRGHILIFHKPDGVLTQFRPVEGKQTLSDFGPFPHDVHPVGRLDEESEGLLLLTSDGVLHQRLIDPQYRHPRTYFVQVERVPGKDALASLAAGVEIEGTTTRPATVKLLTEPPDMSPKKTPIRYRKTVPTAWLEITLTEGKNRQVRRMTAAVGHPTLRLIRISQGPLHLGKLRPGEARDLSDEETAALRASVGLTGHGPFDFSRGKKAANWRGPGYPQGGSGQIKPWSRRGAGGMRNVRGTRGH